MTTVYAETHVVEWSIHCLFSCSVQCFTGAACIISPKDYCSKKLIVVTNASLCSFMKFFCSTSTYYIVVTSQPNGTCTRYVHWFKGFSGHWNNLLYKVIRSGVNLTTFARVCKLYIVSAWLQISNKLMLISRKCQ